MWNPISVLTQLLYFAYLTCYFGNLSSVSSDQAVKIGRDRTQKREKRFRLPHAAPPTQQAKKNDRPSHLPPFIGLLLPDAVSGRGWHHTTCLYGAMANQVTGKQWWVIDPRSSSIMGYWDFATASALVFTALVTPFEVSFLSAPTNKWASPLFLINRVIDLVFIADMLIQPCLAYSTDGVSGKRWVLDAAKIAKHYFASRWFFLDIFSISTSAFDLFGDETTSNIAMLRALRVLRLIKLVRLARSSRILSRWELRLSIDYASISLGVTTIGIIVSCHWFACVWALQASFDRLGSWQFAYCEAYPAVDSEMATFSAAELRDACPSGKVCEIDCQDETSCLNGSSCDPPHKMYFASLYWACVTITSVGYGDIRASLLNPVEQFLCSLLVLAGGLLWASLVGTFAALATNITPEKREYRTRLALLNSFMTTSDLPQKMRFRLREYLKESMHLYRTRRGQEIMGSLSPALQGEVALEVHGMWLDNIWFVEDAPTMLKIELAAMLEPKIIPQGEQSPSGFLYILQRGMALYCGKVMKTSRVWGADILLNNEALQLNVSALAMTYCIVNVISSHGLASVFDAFPMTAQKLQRVRRRWTARRVLLKAAETKAFAEGKTFHGRLYPLYGAAYGQRSFDQKDAFKVKDSFKNNANKEWWIQEEDSDDNSAYVHRILPTIAAQASRARSPIQDLGREDSRSPTSSYEQRKSSSLPHRKFRHIKAKRIRLDPHYESVAQATATLYGAHRMRREMLRAQLEREGQMAQAKLRGQMLSLMQDVGLIKNALGIHAVAKPHENLAETSTDRVSPFLEEMQKFSA